MKIDEKDLLAWYRVQEEKRKEKVISNEKLDSELGKWFSAIITLAYMAIFSVIFYFAQYGLNIFMLDAGMAGKAILYSIVMWILYGYLCIMLLFSFAKKKDRESKE